MRLAILAFAAGVVFLQTLGVLPLVYFLTGAAAVAVVTFGFSLSMADRTPRLAAVVRIIACAVFGFTWAGGLATLRLGEQLPEAWETRDVQLSGVVASLPQRFERGERFEFEVESVLTAGAEVPHRILLTRYLDRDEGFDTHGREPSNKNSSRETGVIEPVAGISPGERWRFTVRLKRPQGNINPHGFDYEAWLLERGVRATGYLRNRAEMQRLDDFVPRPAYVIERLRETIRDRFIGVLPEAPYRGVLTALAVGDQHGIPNTQWTVFNRTGVTHLVSISGLHVTMVGALIAFLFNRLWRFSERLMYWLPAQKAAVAAGWLAALTYAALAGFGVPAQRTLYMLTVVALALWSGRNFGVSRILLLALLIVLIADPWAGLATGFWLSFGAVGTLLFVGSSRVGEEVGWRATLSRWGATQWAVTLGSVPFLLLFFQQFSLVSPFANALAIPFVSFIITPLALIFAVLPWPPLLMLDHWLLSGLMQFLEWLAQWPVWQQAAPPVWAAGLALFGVFWILLPRGVPARWLGLVLLLPALFWLPPGPAVGEAHVDVLDVGQGLAVVVQTANHNLIYDTGPRYGADADAGSRLVVPYLRAAGIRRLDTLVVSHRDDDHSGGLASIRAALPIGRLLSSFSDIGGEPCMAGQSWEWDGVRFSVLHPLMNDYQLAGKKTNDMSCVLRVDTATSSLLLTGDITVANEKALIVRSPGQLASQVLIVPHHGGKGSSSPEFVEAVAAGDVIFSAGYLNAYQHPRSEVLQRYKASKQWRTDHGGAIHVVLGNTTTLTAWRQTNPKYWYDR